MAKNVTKIHGLFMLFSSALRILLFRTEALLRGLGPFSPEKILKILSTADAISLVLGYILTTVFKHFFWD